MLEEAHDIIRPMADMKDISVSTEEAKGLPSLTADRGRLRQIMLNLLSNAVKFTAEGGRVDVEALVAQDGVLRSDQMVPAIRISVSDTGVGIKPEDQYRIFVLFEQVDSSYSRDQEGTGQRARIKQEAGRGARRDDSSGPVTIIRTAVRLK